MKKNIVLSFRLRFMLNTQANMGTLHFSSTWSGRAPQRLTAARSPAPAAGVGDAPCPKDLPPCAAASRAGSASWAPALTGRVRGTRRCRADRSPPAQAASWGEAAHAATARRTRRRSRSCPPQPAARQQRQQGQRSSPGTPCSNTPQSHPASRLSGAGIHGKNQSNSSGSESHPWQQKDLGSGQV